MGKRCTGVLRRGARRRPRGRGLQLPAGARDGDGPGPGYGIASWEQGYGDFAQARRGHAATNSVARGDRTRPLRRRLARRAPVAPSRARSSGGRSSARPSWGSRPCSAPSSSSTSSGELRGGPRQHYRDLTPSGPYILDYHILATTYDEPDPPDPQRGAGIKVETSKGEAWPGQQEINFRYADAVTMADNHTVYKNGSKEIAHLNGCSITFMASPTTRGSGTRAIHSSLWRDGRAFAGESDTFKQYLAGQIACLKELAIFLAPTINSYKRFAAGSWAPTTLAWGHDNRTCGFRIVGHGAGLRTETRIPGGDVNPYSPSPPSSRPGCTGSRTSSSCRRRSRATRTSPTPSASPLAARRDRRARGGDDTRRARRRRRRPLPELRTHGAAPLRRGGHLLRARAHV